MNSIAQLAVRSTRLNGASTLRQTNVIARRAFTNGMSAMLSSVRKETIADSFFLLQVQQPQSRDSSPPPINLVSL